ncbi:MAG: 4Fe-4S dicluster domain-containing protein [Planctomycetota bacterium]|jgi:Fe-S-cluster-containing dehydrogenase component
MRWGFVLDQDACIGCHACTVGCKAENDVPLGAFRTWVKWIEHGWFPDTTRAAAVLRCNHCEDAPCVAICPTIALFQRDDGIVDLDADRCIGCASCMQACPYDAIYIDPREGTAAKCHFCAHRLEVDLAPACVSVCPEQAIKVVDLDDREDIRRDLGERGARRKPERGTWPQTFYLGADPATLDPLAVDGARTLSHAEVPDPMPASGTAEARAVYDIPRQRQWGGHIAAYLATKAVAAGALVAAALSPWSGALDGVWLGWLSLVFLGVTVLLLVGDLHQPRRFFLLLTKPNPGSWLVRGGWILTAHALVSLPWALGAGAWWWSMLGVPVAFATAIYTAFLFWQARGRELWAEDRFLPVVLAAQAGAAAAALGWLFGEPGTIWVLIYAAVVLAATFLRMPTPGARRGHELMVRQPAYALGLVSALAAIAFPPLVFVAFLALDWSYVKAGQEVPLS